MPVKIDIAARFRPLRRTIRSAIVMCTSHQQISSVRALAEIQIVQREGRAGYDRTWDRRHWTGCYLGAQLGGAWADNHFNGQFAGFLIDQNDSSAAVLAGSQVGCDLQFAPNWVIGAQGDGAWTNLTATQSLAGSETVLGAAN
jgi:hypothetical protein